MSAMTTIAKVKRQTKTSKMRSAQGRERRPTDIGAWQVLRQQLPPDKRHSTKLDNSPNPNAQMAACKMKILTKPFNGNTNDPGAESDVGRLPVTFRSEDQRKCLTSAPQPP